MDGTYNNFIVTTSDIPNSNTMNVNNWQPMYLAGELSKKCKCPNTKHTGGCSIEPEDEYCIWCAKGCIKRVQAIHVRYI